MKHFKKLIALFLAMVLATSFATTAMAAETDSGIPENATRHTIELTVAPDGTIEGTDEDGVAPFMWDQENYTVSGDKTYTLQFYVSDRYFAYEMSATNSSGSGNYSVALMTNSGQTQITSKNGVADGTVYKNDWIELPGDLNYLFMISNYTGTSINVTITYYSWA